MTAQSPIKAVTFSLLWAFWVSVMTKATYNPANIPECTGWNVLTGCNDTQSQLFATFALGTIPNADPNLNIVFAIIGVVCRLVGIWSLMTLIRGS